MVEDRSGDNHVEPPFAEVDVADVLLDGVDGRRARGADSLLGAIDAIQMQLGTAIGSAIVLCLAELFPDQGIDLGEMTFGSRHKTRGWDDKEKPRPAPIMPVAP